MPSLGECHFQLSYGASDDRLHEFYIPALAASVRYDRMAGFFTSSALAVAAAGIAHLIANGGQMRLLVGAQLSPQDVDAIREGHDLRDVLVAHFESALPSPEALTDQLMHDRLAALAWMVATGTLTLRVVLPKGPDGLPRPAPEARDYFHPKEGIFCDAEGNQVAFSGSINESQMAWQHNYEQFMVFTSWGAGRVYVAETVGRFERLWEEREPDWISLPVPEAARRKLLRYAPAHAPTRDPLERERAPIRERAAKLSLAPALERERIVCQFLRDAPYLAGAFGLGAATCTLAPWPHQQTVARQLIEHFPARYLLADEVGLGKTIEAGLMLRQLWLSGVVRRALILAPKSVLRQWQEELYEKFALEVPIYDGAVFRDLQGNEEVPAQPNPWDGAKLALVSSQLVKRVSRREVLLDARPWDLVIVDEAHHARRRDFLNLDRYRPNRMLELLSALQSHTRGLVLMTATPMQVHPIEVWDLLNLLGLSDEWGVDGRYFLRFYQQLRLPLGDTDWSFVFRMLRAELETRDAGLNPQFEQQARRQLGVVDWQRVSSLPEDKRSARTMRQLSPQARHWANRMIKRHTPLRRLTFRNTRDLLRRYAEAGLLSDNVPDRDPRPAWIRMREDEAELYKRIEEYITQFYRKYEDERKGLGFVMTVYRRRLTSSFYAIQRSLENRLDFLRGQAGLGLTEDDLEEEALQEDVDELELADRSGFKQEIEYVEDFLHQLRMLGEQDSKVEQLREDLRQAFRERETAIVFTHYTDTMDFLRRQLQQTYGSQVACYSGRGGERWDGVTWIPVTKEEIKNDFREGKEIKILLCTEAASEGLNLQTCGVLINYDMPWNPMRVEQRIGRVDRIGQRYDEVWIRNYFYQDTVEAQVYQALSNRINWFEDVVGPLQPILAQVGRAIKTLAMVPAAERQQAMRDELGHIEAQLDDRELGFDLDAWSEQAEAGAPAATPVTLAELAAELTSAPTLQGHFRPHERIENAFWLQLDGEEVAVTFDAPTFDAHPSTLRLLTFGSPLLTSLLSKVETLPAGRDAQGHILRLKVESPLARVAYYVLDGKGQPQRLDRLADLRAALTSSQIPWTEEEMLVAQRALEAKVQAEWTTMEKAQAQLHEAQRGALKARAARLLLDAALVELALGQQPSLFDDKTYPAAFNQNAVLSLRRHGYPWGPLVGQAHSFIQDPRPTDPFFVEIQGEEASRLERRFGRLEEQAKRLVKEIAQATR
jgi:superfamily II DNA or RNA helicase